MDGEGESITDYCQDLCGEPAAIEYSDGFCVCSSETITTTCEEVCDAAGMSAEPTTSDTSSPDSGASSTLLKPQLSIDIPTVTFSDAILGTNTLGEPTVKSSFLGEYVSGVYVYLIGISTSIAIVMIMISGLQWSLGGQSSEAIGKAKARIKNAVTGLVLLLSTYLILITVNPNLILFKPIELVLILEKEEEEDDVVSGSVATSFASPSESNIDGPGISTIPYELVSGLEMAAQVLMENGYGMYITSSLRTVEKQKELIALNCKNPPGSTTCDPKPGRPTTCILKDLDPANCPHTTGRALDIWATKDGEVCVAQSQCSSDPSTDDCRADECQATLIQALKDQGFCNLQTEAWHFENPKMSTKCY